MKSKRVFLLSLTMLLAVGAGYLLLGLRAPASTMPAMDAPNTAPAVVAPTLRGGGSDQLVLLQPAWAEGHEAHEGFGHERSERERD
jgi:hypothetical protein